jgi:hypothetical protein
MQALSDLYEAVWCELGCAFSNPIVRSARATVEHEAHYRKAPVNEERSATVNRRVFSKETLLATDAILRQKPRNPKTAPKTEEGDRLDEQTSKSCFLVFAYLHFKNWMKSVLGSLRTSRNVASTESVPKNTHVVWPGLRSNGAVSPILRDAS